MPLYRDQSQKGRHIKIGPSFVKLSDIQTATVTSRAGVRELTVVRKSGRPTVVYRGLLVDRVKAVIDVELPREPR